MKKISTLFMGILVALSAVAAPVKMTERAAMEANLPKIEKPVIKAGQFAKFAIDPRFVVADEEKSSATLAQAMLYQGMWILNVMEVVENDTNMVAEFLINNGKDDAIAGEYSLAAKNGMVVYVPEPGDTLELSGTFHVDYVQEGAKYPEYHIYGSNLTDSLSRSFDLDYTAEVPAMDYLAYLYCVYYGVYCDEVVINLSDKPVVPTGDTIQIAIDDLRMEDYQAQAGWWQIMGYSEDSTVFVTLSNVEDKTRRTAVGNYTFEQIDYAYSYLRADGVKLHFADGTMAVSMNEDGTYHVAASLLAKDGKVYELALNSFPLSDNKITIAYANDTLKFTATNDDPYFLFIESQEAYEYYQEDYNQSSLNAEIDDWIESLGSDAADYVANGNIYLLVSTYLGSYAETGDYVALAAPIYENKVRNGNTSYLKFHFVLADGVENVDAAAVKAVKVLRNGQLIIRMNGAEFNALGTFVK